MKSTLLAFALLLLASSSFGQTEFAPSGATWSYSYQTFWTSFNGFLVLRYEKDTLIGNFQCKKLQGDILDSTQAKVDDYYDLFIRQSGDSIFTVFGTDSYFLFKNSYQVNEIATFDLLWNDPLTVSAIETLNFGGQTTKKFTLDSDGWLFDQTAIYEHFGPERGFIQSWWGVEVDGESFRLLCYKDDNFPLAEVGDGPCFGFTATEENSPATVGLSVFPNPAADEITFDFHGNEAWSMNLVVWDFTGKTVMESPYLLGKTLDISFLPSGIYFGNMRSNQLALPFKFIKQ